MPQKWLNDQAVSWRGTGIKKQKKPCMLVFWQRKLISSEYKASDQSTRRLSMTRLWHAHRILQDPVPDWRDRPKYTHTHSFSRVGLCMHKMNTLDLLLWCGFVSDSRAFSIPSGPNFTRLLVRSFQPPSLPEQRFVYNKQTLDEYEYGSYQMNDWLWRITFCLLQHKSIIKT